MTSEAIARVRRFNRTATQRVGALEERYLGRDRRLGESRVLWEIGTGGRDVRSLRAELGLDSGYLSRLLRSLEAEGLVTVEPSGADRRVRLARLTETGRAEWRLLDERSDEAAAALLAPLTSRQRDRLVAAMAEVDTLLRAGSAEFTVVDPDHPDARFALDSYYAELDRRFSGGFDQASSIAPSDKEFAPPDGLLVLARIGAEPVGCGALRFRGEGISDIKRMWIAELARGMGLGRRLLDELEARAVGHGVTLVRLESNRVLTEALTLYRSAGYREVQPFNDELYGDHWFEKDLTVPETNLPLPG